MKDNRKKGTRLANQTGSQSGNPRNQQIQREGTDAHEGMNESESKYRNTSGKRDNDTAGEGKNRKE